MDSNSRAAAPPWLRWFRLSPPEMAPFLAAPNKQRAFLSNMDESTLRKGSFVQQSQLSIRSALTATDRPLPGS
jgi:hypothetical protein